MGKEKIEQFKKGIFTLHTRRFGSVAEIMIKKLYNLEKSDSIYYDMKDKQNKRIEIKFATVLKANTSTIKDNNVIEQCTNAILEIRKMASEDVPKYKFDCNFQQIKCAEFDILYYGLFYSDKIEIYKMTTGQVLICKGYSNKQHKGNKNEGQFHIKNDNLEYHRKNYLQKTLTYEELYELFKQ